MCMEKWCVASSREGFFSGENPGWFGKSLALGSGRSLAEIKDQLPRLSAEERRELARAMLALEAPREPATEARPAASFAEAQAYVFENYGDRLRRLAQ